MLPSSASYISAAVSDGDACVFFILYQPLSHAAFIAIAPSAYRVRARVGVAAWRRQAHIKSIGMAAWLARRNQRTLVNAWANGGDQEGMRCARSACFCAAGAEGTASTSDVALAVHRVAACKSSRYVRAISIAAGAACATPSSASLYPTPYTIDARRTCGSAQMLSLCIFCAALGAMARGRAAHRRLFEA